MKTYENIYWGFDWSDMLCLGNKKMKEVKRPPSVLLSRFIGPEDEILQFLREIEERFNIKLYPDTPRIDRQYPDCVRIYVKIPLDRPPVKKEVSEE